jgi:hypothetical protein
MLIKQPGFGDEALKTTLTNQRWFNVNELIAPEITLPAHFLGFLILVDSSSHFLWLWKIEPSS